MFYKPLVYPLLIQVALTAAVWIWLYATRLTTIVKNDIDPESLKVAADSQQKLKHVAGPSDNFRNLFEAPVLYYVAILLALELLLQNRLLISLAWTYVFLRIAHSIVHVTYNRVAHRFMAYFSSTLVLWAMWGVIAYEVWQR